MNNRISAFFSAIWREKGVDNHFVRRLSPTEQLVRRVRILPLEVVVRNRVGRLLAKRLGLEEGTVLAPAGGGVSLQER